MICCRALKKKTKKYEKLYIIYLMIGPKRKGVFWYFLYYLTVLSVVLTM